MKQKNIVVVGLGFVLLGLLAFFFLKPHAPPGGGSAGNTLVIDQMGAPAGQEQVTQDGKFIVSGTVEAVSTNLKGAEFQNWLKNEAKTIDSTQLNSETKRRELDIVIKGLNADSAKILKSTVLDTNATAGEKILSTYMLAGGGDVTTASLLEIIEAPPTHSGPVKPHSEDEMRSVQERSLKAMALEGLVEKAKRDPKARQQLEELATRIQDSYMRDYVQKRLKELGPR